MSGSYARARTKAKAVRMRAEVIYSELMHQRLLQVLLLVAASTSLEAQDHVQWMVDQMAPGPGSGTLTDPFVTIAQAMAVAGFHDHIHVMPGVYTERVDITESRFLHSMNGPEHTIIDATGQPGYYAVNAHNLVEIVGFTIRKADGVGIRVAPPAGTPWDGILFLRNRVEGCPLGGIEITGQVTGVISDNIIRNNANYGVLTAWGSSMLLRNCTLTGNGIGVLSIGSAYVGTPCAANSIFWGNVFSVFGLSATQLNTCIVGEASLAGVNGNMHMDPMFQTMMAGDLRLMPASPCIDAANPIHAVFYSLFDYRGFGYPRVADGNHDFIEALDIGAMEHGGLSSGAMPAAGSGGGTGGMGGMVSTPSNVTLMLDAGMGNAYVLALGMASMNPWNPIWGSHGLFYLDATDYVILASGVQTGMMEVTLNFYIPGGIPIPGTAVGSLSSGGMGMGNGIGFPVQALVQEMMLPSQPLWWSNCEMVLPMM